MQSWRISPQNLGIQQILNDPARKQLADEMFAEISDRYRKNKDLSEEQRQARFCFQDSHGQCGQSVAELSCSIRFDRFLPRL